MSKAENLCTTSKINPPSRTPVPTKKDPRFRPRARNGQPGGIAENPKSLMRRVGLRRCRCAARPLHGLEGPASSLPGWVVSSFDWARRVPSAPGFIRLSGQHQKGSGSSRRHRHADHDHPNFDFALAVHRALHPSIPTANAAKGFLSTSVVGSIPKTPPFSADSGRCFRCCFSAPRFYTKDGCF
jgi:hypothetical protein